MNENIDENIERGEYLYRIRELAKRCPSLEIPRYGWDTPSAELKSIYLNIRTKIEELEKQRKQEQFSKMQDLLINELSNLRADREGYQNANAANNDLVRMVDDFMIQEQIDDIETFTLLLVSTLKSLTTLPPALSYSTAPESATKEKLCRLMQVLDMTKFATFVSTLVFYLGMAYGR